MKNIVAALAAVSLIATAAFAKEPAKPAKQMTITPTADLKWMPLMPDNPQAPQIAVVHGDLKKGPVSFFIKLPKGSKSPIHIHTSDYEAAVIQGTPIHFKDEADAKPLQPGSFFFQPGKDPHGDGCVGDVDCISYIAVHGPFDFAPAGKDAKPAGKEMPPGKGGAMPEKAGPKK